ncbi:MAG: type II toxin-antitoxin system RelE/ParE family toxin [bacterium]|nr:type II toxin-antitoxin system RelE/ParE family toxin [bacterium]
MNWQINFSRESLKFLEKNNYKEDFVIEKIKIVLQKFKGEDVNINIKKLAGEWKGFYRIRFGKLRIIAEFQFECFKIYIDRIDWRGDVYK